MSVEQRKSLVRYIMEEVGRGNLDVLEEHPGLQELVPNLQAWRDGFSHIELTFPLQFVDGEWVATRITYSAVNSGSFMGRPPTNRRVENEVLMFHRVVDGKIVQQHSQGDVSRMMDQLGVLPAAMGA